MSKFFEALARKPTAGLGRQDSEARPIASRGPSAAEAAAGRPSFPYSSMGMAPASSHSTRKPIPP